MMDINCKSEVSFQWAGAREQINDIADLAKMQWFN